jgi:hypothetical protein
MAPAAGKHGHAMPHLTGHDRRCLKGLPHQSRQYLASRDTLFVSQLLHGDQNVVFYGKRRPHASDATASDAARQFSAVQWQAAVRRRFAEVCLNLPDWRSRSPFPTIWTLAELPWAVLSCPYWNTSWNRS